MRNAIFGVFLVIGLLSFGADQAKPKTESARTAIEAANRAFEAAHLRGDVAALVAQYAEDAEILWENRDVLRGHKAIEQAWRDDLPGPGRKAKITTLEIEQHGDWAYEMGKMNVTGQDGALIYDGKYLCIWKRIKSEWKIYRDIANSSSAAKPGVKF